jgi:virulence factor
VVADEEQVVDVGVIGLGDIATKAYLPLLAARPDVRLHLASRDAARTREAAARFRAVSTSEDETALLEHDLDAVFVTAATSAHPRLVAAALDARVAVHVDKPLADTADGVRSLVELARARDVLLTVGFNRRFAPAYRRLAAVTDPPLVLMHKHRPDLPDTVRQVVFDDFVHVVDTLRWLLGSAPTRIDVAGRVVDGELHHVLVTLGADGRHAVGTMDRVSGATTESLEVHGVGGTLVVHDVARTEERRGDAVRLERPGDWEPTLRTRGFEAMVDAFLAAVAGAHPEHPTSDDVLATHLLCETIVDRLGALSGP